MTEKELTWVATVFDCEGCLDRWIKQYVKKSGKTVEYNIPRIQISNSSHKMILRLQELTRMGKIYGPYQPKGKYTYKQRWVWIVRGQNVNKFLEMIWDEWLSDARRETAITLNVAPIRLDKDSEAYIDAWINKT